MLTTLSQIKWGPGEENILTFDFPVDNIRVYRRPRPGQSRIRIPGAGYDVWRSGRDWMLEWDARWLSYQKYSDPLGIQAFIDYGSDGGSFSFVPDATIPDFVIPGCFLEAPSDAPNPGSEQSGDQIVRFVIGNPTYNLGQALRGVMLDYAPGMSLVDPVAHIFTRASAANRRGLPSSSMAAAIGASDLANVLRDRHYEGSLKTALLECAGVQLVTDPENFGNWTIGGVLGRTSGQADPFGGTNAWLLDSNTPAGGDGLTQNVVFTGDGTKVILLFIRQDNSPASQIALRDVTAGVFRHLVTVTWTNGVPSLSTSTGSGTLFPVIPWGAGWYLVAIGVNGVIAANTNRFDIYPDTTGTGAHIFVFGANAWNDSHPFSYQGPSLTTRQADLLYRPFPYIPQGAFFYWKFVERGNTKGVGTIRMWRWGGGAPGSSVAPHLYITFNGVYGSRLDWGTGGGVSSATVATVPNVGDVVEMLLTLDPAASVMTLAMAVNGGAPVVGSNSSTNTGMPAAMPDPTFYINGVIGDGRAAWARMKVGTLTHAGVRRDTIAKALAA